MQIKLSEGTDAYGLGVPYPINKTSDVNNAGYFDLKKELHRISEIHELQKYPELLKVVIAINQPNSFFRTLRCGDVISTPLLNNLQNKKVFFFYVTIAFEILEFNTAKGNYIELCHRFSRTNLTHSKRTFIEFRIIPTSYNNHGINRAWSMDIEISGIGQTDEKARLASSLGWRAIQSFLDKESSLFIDELKKGQKTIS
jgi:hypothetical protein